MTLNVILQWIFLHYVTAFCCVLLSLLQFKLNHWCHVWKKVDNMSCAVGQCHVMTKISTEDDLQMLCDVSKWNSHQTFHASHMDKQIMVYIKYFQTYRHKLEYMYHHFHHQLYYHHLHGLSEVIYSSEEMPSKSLLKTSV